MFTFKSPVNPKHSWTLCFRDKKEMNAIIYEDRTPDPDVRFHGITNFAALTVYIDKELDGFPLTKALRHELTHVYLWETGQQDRKYSEEDLCDIMSVAAPIINETVDNIILRLKEGLYKKGE